MRAAPRLAWIAALSARSRDVSDTELLSRLKAGEEDEVFAILLQRYQERIFRLAVSILGREGQFDAEDVAQEVFLKLYRKLHTFRCESRLSTWIYRIAYRMAIDARRRPRHRYRHVEEGSLEGLSTTSPVTDRTVSGELAKALQQLPARQRSAVLLHYWMGYSTEEIAELHAASTGTVKAWLHRARRRLGQLLELPS